MIQAIRPPLPMNQMKNQTMRVSAVVDMDIGRLIAMPRQISADDS